MRAQESIHWTDIDATPAQFTLNGGVYCLAAVSGNSDWGTLTLNIVLPDGSSVAAVATALSADGISSPLYLPPGLYELTLGTVTGITASITRVPVE